MCPPVSMISFDFGKTTAKMTFLQSNHTMIALKKAGFKNHSQNNRTHNFMREHTPAQRNH